MPAEDLKLFRDSSSVTWSTKALHVSGSPLFHNKGMASWSQVCIRKLHILTHNDCPSSPVVVHFCKDHNKALQINIRISFCRLMLGLPGYVCRFPIVQFVSRSTFAVLAKRRNGNCHQMSFYYLGKTSRQVFHRLGLHPTVRYGQK